MKNRSESWMRPEIRLGRDKKEENLIAEMELLGVRKKDIDLEIEPEGFCVRADKGLVHYDACYPFFHNVKADKAKAVYSDGMLRVTIPIDRSTMYMKRLRIR